MDERDAEERPEEMPLAEQPEPSQDAQASMADSTRESSGDEPMPAPDVAAAEEAVDATASTPEVTEAAEQLTEAAEELSKAAGQLAQAAEELSEAADEVTEQASEGPEAPVAVTEAEVRPAPAMSPAQEHRAAAAEGLRRGRLPQGDVPAEGSEEPAWYVIHCYSGYENKVRHNLEQRIETMGMKDRIFDVVIPTQEEIEVREGKRRTVERHIFPGYVLVNMTLSEESWYVVRNTPGVTGFVGMGNLPTPLRPEEVSQIIKRMESEAPAVKVSFKPGERVRIIDGPFNDFRGTVADLDVEHSKVRVMVSFFGRETPVELDFLQVEKA